MRSGRSFPDVPFLSAPDPGRGIFAAVARKVSDGGSRVRVPKSRRTIFAPAGRRECAELARWVAEPGRMRFAAVADVYYAYYESQYEAVKMLAESLRVIASGVAMGQIFKERLKPIMRWRCFADWIAERCLLPSCPKRRRCGFCASRRRRLRLSPRG